MALFQDVFGKQVHLLGREVYLGFHNSLLLYSVFRITRKEKNYIFLIGTLKFESNTQCEE